MQMMKMGGKAAAATLVGLSSLWLTLGHQLTDSAAAIIQWVTTLLGQ